MIELCIDIDDYFIMSSLSEQQGNLLPSVTDPQCDGCETFGGYGTYNGYTLTRNNVQRDVFSDDAFATRKDVCCPCEFLHNADRVVLVTYIQL